MKIHRTRSKPHFTKIPNETLRDPRLSYQARGVLAEILSRTDSWQTTADAMWRQARRDRGSAGEGRKALRAAFAELEAAGYIRRVRRRTDGGLMVTELHVYDVSAGRTDDRAGGMPVSPGETTVSPGRTDDQTGSSRSYLGERASSQVAPAYRQPAVGQPAVGQPAAGRVVVSTKTEDEDLNTKTEDEDPVSLSLAGMLRAAVPAATEREIDQTVTKIEADHRQGRIQKPRAYLRTLISKGDAAALIEDARAGLAEGARTFPARPDWCGECNQITRMIGEDAPRRCTACHPLTRHPNGAQPATAAVR